MSTSKRILLIVILLFPALLYFLFELSEANFKKMAYYGPRTFDAAANDTMYYSVPLSGFVNEDKSIVSLDTTAFPVFLIGFLNDQYRKDGYKLQGLLDLTQYKPEKLKLIDIFMVSAFDSIPQQKKPELKIGNKDIREIFCSDSTFKEMNARFFKDKPMHVFPYFFVLVDKQRNIRGYYDPTYVAEVKRMIQEFEHLKLRDEKANMIRRTTIEKK